MPSRCSTRGERGVRECSFGWSQEVVVAALPLVTDKRARMRRGVVVPTAKSARLPKARLHPPVLHSEALYSTRSQPCWPIHQPTEARNLPGSRRCQTRLRSGWNREPHRLPNEERARGKRGRVELSWLGRAREPERGSTAYAPSAAGSAGLRPPLCSRSLSFHFSTALTWSFRLTTTIVRAQHNFQNGVRSVR